MTRIRGETVGTSGGQVEDGRSGKLLRNSLWTWDENEVSGGGDRRAD